MANNGDITSYTAEDIEKYHQGNLNAAEMHAMEKAALEDPFLADALEGMTHAGSGLQDDLTDLQERLRDRTSNTRLVTMIPANRSGFTWLRTAAMVVIVLGASLLVYQLGFRKKESSIAEGRTPEVNAAKPHQDKGKGPDSARVPGQTKAYGNESAINKPSLPATVTTPQPVGTESKATTQGAPRSSPEVVARLTAASEKEKKSQETEDNLSAKDMSTASNSREVIQPGSPRGVTMANRNMNIFQGKITDAKRNAVPFANIIVPGQQVNTYSDAKGNFVIVSPDTTVDVQVRSLGYQSQNTALKNQNQVSQNNIQLMEEVVVMGYGTERRRQAASSANRNDRKNSNAQPVDGWSNYDIYIANNSRRQELEFGGDVELGFDIDETGTPVNITILQTLCLTCDKEAIRLLKEGPKWKPGAAKGRNSITISF